MIKLKLAAAIAACFAGAALAAPEIVETVKTAPEPAPVVVAVAEPAAPAVVDANMVRDLNTPSKEAAPDAVKGCTKKNAQCVRDMYQAFMDANGWPVSGKDAKGKSYYFGTASVSFPKTNAAYGKSLALAYNEAYLNAINEFSRTMVLETANQLASSAFADSSSDARSFPRVEDNGGKSQWEALYDKVMALSQGKLDQGLRSLGINPEQFNAVPPDERKKLLENTLVNKSTEHTYMALGGINVVGNFVHEAANGTADVGVAIAYSPSIEGVAQSLRMGKRPAIKAVGQSLDVQIPKDPALLADMYGPRLMIDEQGPVIVSFAFWMPEKAPERFQGRMEEAAFRQAETEANAQIARFLSVSFSGELTTEAGQTVGQDAVKSGKDGSITDQTTEVITDRFSEKNVARSQAKLKGVKTVRRWNFTTPEGLDLVGVVKAYSFGNIEYANSITDKGTAASDAEPQQKTAPEAPAGTSSSRQGSVKSAIDVF